MVKVSVVHGHAARPGTVSVVAAQNAPATPATLVLLPGDISTAHATMIGSSMLAQYSAWSCENLAKLLARRWPTYNAVVVHPPRAVDGFSCYDDWLSNLDQTGDPAAGYDGSGTACAHLLAQLNKLPDVGSSSPLHLIGFSKGAVPLNQILAEIGGESGAGDDSPAGRLLARIDTMTWLDPGLNREPGPILLGSTAADTALLRIAGMRMRARASRSPRLAVTLTPYQMQPRSWLRSWSFVWHSWPPIRRESDAVAARRRFERLLRRESVLVACDECLTERPPSLENHFEVLNAFTAPWDASE